MLRLLLDEHVSPKVAEGLRRRAPSMVVHALANWEGGNFLGQDDSACLMEAARQRLTLVTYDRRTIPLLLKTWAESGRRHGGVILGDEKTIAPADVGDWSRHSIAYARHPANGTGRTESASCDGDGDSIQRKLWGHPAANQDPERKLIRLAGAFVAGCNDPYHLVSSANPAHPAILAIQCQPSCFEWVWLPFPALSAIIEIPMKESYRRWMHDWETRMTSRDVNRVVRPFEWGSEFVSRWPLTAGMTPPPDEADKSAPFDFWSAVNDRIIANSDDFYSYKTPTDFRLEHRRVELFHTGSEPPKKPIKESYASFLRFTSPVHTEYPENNIMNARWFPAHGHRAVIVMPQWNADAISHNGLCQIFNMLGISALRMSMPYHDIRRPAGLTRADYAVSANVGRTIDSVRQGIADIRSCLDWLQQRGYTKLGLVGTSLGSCYAFIAAAHDPRISVNVFNHASTAFGDVAWTGQSTRHIRQSVEAVLTHDELRRVWMSISPIVYFDKFQRWPRKSLMIYGRYDLTFLPEFSIQAAGEFLKRGIDTTVKALPCGHYSLGETPYKYMDAWHISRFLSKAFAG